MNLTAVLEGLLFLAGDEGLTIEQMQDVLEIKQAELAKLLNELEQTYQNENHGIHIEVLGNAFKLTTKKEHKEYYEKLVEVEDSSFLSQAALETLAIVAYNEPITRVKVDEIRGVSSSHMIRKLINKNLIHELGKSDLPGRPNLYGTTKQFLDYFGLSRKEDLPKLEQIVVTDEEKDLFESKYKEE